MRVSGCSRLPVPPARMTPFIGRIIVQRMGDQPQTPSTPRTAFSPDGMWWWDGSQWRPAISPDGKWRWDGRGWVPAGPGPPRAGGGAGAANGITVVAFIRILVLVPIPAIVIPPTIGHQTAHASSNAASALGATP